MLVKDHYSLDKNIITDASQDLINWSSNCWTKHIDIIMKYNCTDLIVS